MGKTNMNDQQAQAFQRHKHGNDKNPPGASISFENTYDTLRYATDE